VTIKQIKVFSPGSIANLGPGFDVFAIALENMGDYVTLNTISESKIIIEISGIGAEMIPIDNSRNSAGAILEYIKQVKGIKHGFKVDIQKGVPPGKGLGSSGSSAAGTAYAVNQLLELGLSDEELVRLASIGESAIAGSPHADNVSASLFGGFVMVDQDFKVVRLDAIDIGIVVVAPCFNIENKTKAARELLPDKVYLKDAVYNIGNASKMAVAVAINDPVLFGSSISDHVIEPYRAKMIPHFWEVKEAALKAGAYGCSIAGGGPSVFAMGDDIESIGEAMVAAFQDVDSNLYFTRPSNLGVREV
jgi:homoserine kinase